MSGFTIESLARSVLRVGELRVDVGRMLVVERGEEGRLTPKALGVLVELARHPMKTVTRAELLDRLWPDSQPTPDALSHAVRELRRALGDDARAPAIVDTVHGLGYRLLQPVQVEDIAAALEFPPGTQGPAKEPVASDIPEAVVPEPGVASASPSPLSASPQAPHARRIPALLLAGLLVAVIVAAAVAAAWWRTPVPMAASTQADTPGPAPWDARLITSDPAAEEFPKLSPDGAMVVFTRRTLDGRWDLSVMSVNGAQPLAITDTPDEDELWPVWSPDGASIAFLHIVGAQCSIDVMPATGGVPLSVAACDRVVWGAIDWSPDGSHLLTSLPSNEPGRELRVHRVPLDGSAPQPLQYHAERAGWDRDPAYSPDGKRIAFRRGLPPDYDVFVMGADGGEARRLTHLGAVGEGLTWSPDGREVIFWSQHDGAPALYRVDAASGVVSPTGLANASRPHVARQRGTLVYQRPWLRVGMAAADIDDPGAEAEVLSGSTGDVGFIAATADRQRLAYVSNRGGFEQVWVHELDGRADRAFGERDLKRIMSLDWSDDGRRLLVVVRDDDVDRALELDIGSGRFTDLGLSRPLLRDAVGSDRRDRLYAIVEGDDRPMLARFDRDAGGWRETVSEIAATELIRLPGVPGLFARTPLRPEMIMQVQPDLTMREIELHPRVYGWSAADGAVWYLSSPRRAMAELRRYDLATGEDRALRPMPHHMPRRRASSGLIGDRFVVALLLEDLADIGLVSALPGAGH